MSRLTTLVFLLNLSLLSGCLAAGVLRGSSSDDDAAAGDDDDSAAGDDDDAVGDDDDAVGDDDDAVGDDDDAVGDDDDAVGDDDDAVGDDDDSTGDDDDVPTNCPGGEIEDCNGNCAPLEWIGDDYCDDENYEWPEDSGVMIQLNCAEFDFDEGDCDGNEGPPRRG